MGGKVLNYEAKDILNRRPYRTANRNRCRAGAYNFIRTLKLKVKRIFSVAPIAV